MILAKKLIKIGQLRLKLEPYFKSNGVEIFTIGFEILDLKIGHNFSLTWPILMIFVANIINSRVLIDIMMTRMVQA